METKNRIILASAIFRAALADARAQTIFTKITLLKTRFSKAVRALSLLGLVVWAAGRQAGAQTPAQLAIQTYAGLSITGAVGSVYSVEYVTALAQTNDWRCLTFLQLPATNYLWFDPTAPATSKRFYRAVQFGAPTNMVFIPPGTFRIGSPTNEVDRFDDEGPQTAVTISRGFWMGTYLVTQGEYQALMGSNPSAFNTNNGFSLELTRPVEQVGREGATNYCAALTQQERAAGRIATNSVYRLPTEAEWEYACRGWTSTRFSYGDDPGYTNLTQYAWYRDNSGGMTHPVGQKLPNPWGLYDMHGNVFEWCQDRYGDYAGGTALDPQGIEPPLNGGFRGGSHDSEAKFCRSARHTTPFLADYGSLVGFRVVLAPGQL